MLGVAWCASTTSRQLTLFPVGSRGIYTGSRHMEGTFVSDGCALTLRATATHHSSYNYMNTMAIRHTLTVCKTSILAAIPVHISVNIVHIFSSTKSRCAVTISLIQVVVNANRNVNGTCIDLARANVTTHPKCWYNGISMSARRRSQHAQILIVCIVTRESAK